MDVTLPDQASVRVTGKTAQGAKVAVCNEILRLSWAAESETLKLHQEHGGKRVVDHRDVYVGAVESVPLEEDFCHRRAALHDSDVLRVVVAGDLLLEQASVRYGTDEHRSVTPGCTVGGGDHQGHGPIGFLAAIEESDGWFGDPAGSLVLVQCDRLLVEVGVRIVGGILSELHDRTTKILARHAVCVHIADRIERHP